MTHAHAVVLQQKSNMGVGESFAFLARSTYIRDLATLVGIFLLTPVMQVAAFSEQNNVQNLWWIHGNALLVVRLAGNAQGVELLEYTSG